MTWSKLAYKDLNKMFHQMRLWWNELEFHMTTVFVMNNRSGIHVVGFITLLCY